MIGLSLHSLDVAGETTSFVRRHVQEWIIDLLYFEQNQLEKGKDDNNNKNK
jgi:hypothetical protein